MSNIDSRMFNRIVDLLVPHMPTTDKRDALLKSALLGCPVLRLIDYEGDADTSTKKLVARLIDYGSYQGVPTIVSVLEEAKKLVGEEKQVEFNSIIVHIRHPLNMTAFPTIQVTGKRIFISYARPEQSIAEQVEKVLRHAGFDVFRDTSDIRSGDDWDAVIEAALRDCDRMVLLLSKASMPERKEVKCEWFYFDQKKKPIYPLYIEDCDLHSRFISYNYIDCRTDLQGALSKLLQELDKSVNAVDEPLAVAQPQIVAAPILPKLTELVNQLNKIDWIADWTIIPGGKFTMGDENMPNAPLREVDLQPYIMAQTPVTQAQYQRFVRIAQHRLPVDEFSQDYSWDENERIPPQDKLNHPVVLVSADDAEAYCKWLTDELRLTLSALSGTWVVSLPSESEWELAARGLQRHPYPWGEGLPSSRLANFDSPGTTPVGQYQHQRPYAVLDMIGNVWEWTRDSEGGKRILRGGSWQPGISIEALHAAYRYPETPAFMYDTVGFRVVIRQLSDAEAR
jgi:formylglycine-generating enzyme required for sulfatase activity